MNELITLENGIAVLNPETASKIAEFERQAKAIKEAEDALREQILTEMELKQIKSVETEGLLIMYREPHDRETFDTKTFKMDFPDLADEYTKLTLVKASVAIKVK